MREISQEGVKQRIEFQEMKRQKIVPVVRDSGAELGDKISTKQPVSCNYATASIALSLFSVTSRQ